MASFYPNELWHGRRMTSRDYEALCGRPTPDRVYRALHQDLQLLHRSHSTFFVLGATGNVYTVTLSISPSCSCPDPVTPCKHILFVLIRVLGVSPDDDHILQSPIPLSEHRRLLDQPTSPATLADAGIRQMFPQLFFNWKQARADNNVEVEDGSSCPICLNEMKKEEKILACGACRNPIHELCFARWKKSKVNRIPSCVMCRAPWKDDDYDQHMYLNLSAYTRQLNDED
ncbi:hypothetical protein QN277_001939 [Acacia crassicarpa]|uniref:Mitogen-activated protein kinase kinase kinase 1 n=1 Tax=Acacia crassicarpa TaxID=499986 RepID=A0AAE1N875_9FABA|nr:hypothetical protein QN277_001939 [Acacia crassicarpa]